MDFKTRKTLCATGLAVILAATGTVVLSPLTIDIAYAQGNSGDKGGSAGGERSSSGSGGDRGSNSVAGERGSNGGDGGSNRSGEAEGGGEVAARSAVASPGGAGRGALASELKSLNAAHASPQALANASPDSMPGKLSAFKEGYQSVYDATLVLNDAKEALADYPEFATEFQEGTVEHDDALAAYNLQLQELEDTVSDAELALAEENSTYTASYLTLTGGVDLSTEAEEELMRLLGLR